MTAGTVHAPRSVDPFNKANGNRLLLQIVCGFIVTKCEPYDYVITEKKFSTAALGLKARMTRSLQG